jgi:hypothetical protein
MFQGYEASLTRGLPRLFVYSISYRITSILLGVARCEKLWKQRVQRRKKVSTLASEDVLVLGGNENPR